MRVQRAKVEVCFDGGSAPEVRAFRIKAEVTPKLDRHRLAGAGSASL
jgi:hypothetical protein